MGIDDEHHFFFECPYYHEFRQLLEQSVQDTLITGPKFVAVNLSVSLLLAPWPSTGCLEDSVKIFWRPHLNILNKLVGDSDQHLSSLLISVLIKQQNNKNIISEIDF